MKIQTALNFCKWAFNFRKKGVPIQYFNDTEYIDWFINCKPFLEQFKNIHDGKDCFIVGNGPSLNNTDLVKLNDYYVFGLNKIHLIFEKQPLQLSYHVTVNELVIDQTINEFKKDVYGCPSFLGYHISKQVDFNKERIHKLFTRTAPWSFYHSILQPIHEGYTVTYVALQLAFYMGFKNVFLVGVDHNFQQQGKPNEQQEYQGDDVNHFHPDYFKGQQWHLADLEGNEASYALAKHQFHTAGRNIYDATIGGKLNIFTKVSYEEALTKARKK
jgi:hypothetical protein